MTGATTDRTVAPPRGASATTRATTATRRLQHAELKSEVLHVLRARADAGRSPTTTMRDVVGEVIIGHLPLGDAGGRAMKASDAPAVADALVELLAGLPHVSGPWADAIGAVYLTPQVRKLLGTGRPISRQALVDRVERRTMLGLRTSDRRSVYPAWQFRRRQVLPGVPEVLQAFGGGSGGEPVIDCWSLASWLRTPLAELDGDSVAHRLLLGDSDDALRAARTAAARWDR